MNIYAGVLDGVNSERKSMISGQATLFDFAEEDSKADLEVSMPEVGEFDKELILAFEKEVLGVYISGHPLEEYEEMLHLNVTRYSNDFIPVEGSDIPVVRDEETAVIGGLVAGKTVKTTRTNSMMAFVSIEDMLGIVEVIVFPKDYEKYRMLLEDDRKVFVKGRVTVEEDKPAKLICSKIVPFDEVPRELWIQCQTKEKYLETEDWLFQTLTRYDGRSTVVIYLREEKAKKQLPRSRTVQIDKGLLENLYEKYGKDNVKVVEKSIEKCL